MICADVPEETRTSSVAVGARDETRLRSLRRLCGGGYVLLLPWWFGEGISVRVEQDTRVDQADAETDGNQEQ